MEALGAAASVIGVVSLAIQLVKTVQDLNSFLTSLDGAPEEVQRLIGDLTQLKGVLQDVRNVAEMQQLQNDTPVLVSTMDTALKGCQKEIRTLSTILTKAQIGYGSTRRLARKWNSLKFVFKKKDIEDFGVRLQHSMQLLMMSLIANMSNISLSTHNNINILLANSRPFAQIDSETSSTVSWLKPSQDLTIRIGPRVMFRNEGRYFHKRGPIIVTASVQEPVWTGRHNNVKPKFGRKRTISISALFLQHFVRVQLEMGNGCWKHSFTMYQTVPRKQVIWKLCSLGDVTGLQKLFSEGQSPFIRDKFGGTLIHCAARHQQTETIKFLFQLGVDPNLADHDGDLPLCSSKDIESCRLLISHGHNDPATLPSWWFNNAEPEGAFYMLHQDEFLFESQKLQYLLHYTAASFARSFVILEVEFSTKSLVVWSRLVSRLIQDGHNLSDFNWDGTTALDALFGNNPANAPGFDSQSLGDRWFTLLASIPVDLKEYIKKERGLHPDGFVIPWDSNSREDWNEDYVQRRYVFEDDTNQIPTISWEWFISSESPADLILGEFKSICLECGFLSKWKDFWPYYEEGWQSPEKIKTIERRWARKAELRERRLNHYKTPREYQPRRRGHRMPGSWTEDRYAPSIQPSKSSLPIPRWLITTLVGLAGHLLVHMYLTQRIRINGEISGKIG